uniref:Golgi resident protein GCP60-like n=1 Tax=Labrus bergylta TaxID=56723 RepID=A0A3Q3MV72_9LABR
DGQLSQPERLQRKPAELRQTQHSGSTGRRAGEPGDGAPVTPERGQQQPTNREPQHTGVFTVIPPNESQRRKTILISQKEEEDLKRWKEANRPSSVHTNPEKLGGHVTLAEAREKQSADLRSSKLRKKLMKAECDKKRRQEEEEELEKMKAVQREKAEQQEQRRRQEEQRRRELHRQDHLRATESLVQRFERRVLYRGLRGWPRVHWHPAVPHTRHPG